MKYFGSCKMIYALRPLIIVFIVLCSATSCQDQFSGNEKYQRPDWLVGKIYTQIDAQEHFKMFAQCMRDVGYDTIVNKSGAYAAFAPTDAAFLEFLTSKGYSSVSEIPYNEKMGLVRFHLVQMPWNMEQLQGLSVRGWIDENDISNNKPFAFKRQTLHRNPNRSYPVKIQTQGLSVVETIVSEDESNATKTVYSNSRKYVPLFFDKYLTAMDLFAGDYSFYFNRSYEHGSIYFAGAKIISEELFSDNGFIYSIDKVVEPLKNAEELMEDGFGNDTYLQFKKLINQGSEFQFNESATYSQAGASEGLEVEELFNLTYPGIGFGIHQELTFNPNSPSADGQTMQNHYGIVVPTDEAFQEFVEEVLTKSGKISGINQIPVNLKKMIINNHMSEAPIYEQDVKDGFFNAEGDFIKIDQASIIQKDFGSNATFIGVDKMLVPKALSSVSGFLYLDPAYLTYLMALDYADLLGALKDEDTDVTLFAIPNGVFVMDQSMDIQWKTWREDNFDLRAYSILEEKWIKLKRSEVADLMFSQIGIQPLNGIAKKEFIETLNGKHIVVDNESKTITGGVSSVFGYSGDSTITVNYKSIEGDFYNGKAYEIDGWLRFPAQPLISRLYGTTFFNLLRKANLATEFELRFVHPAERYTVFLPSQSALETAQADTLQGEDLKRFLLTHILKDELMFTDGRMNEGQYRTMSRTVDGTGFNFLQIQPSVDNISIRDGDGNVIVDIPEDGNRTNVIAVKTQNDLVSTNAVIHNIDSVIPLDITE